MQFQDKWTRWHHKPCVDGQYSSNNAWIYSAECLTTGLLESDILNLAECFNQCRTEYGFKRHPDREAPPISHDEVIGLIFVMSLVSSLYAKHLMRQWIAQKWQICDLPGFKPRSWWTLNWFGVIYDFYQIYKLDKLHTKTNGTHGLKARQATLLYPRVFPIAFHMNGWKRYLIKRHSGYKTTIFEGFSFFFSKLFTIYGSKGFSSGKRLLGFQLKMLENKTFMEKLIEKAYYSRYNLKDIAAQEYAAGHPILERL